MNDPQRRGLDPNSTVDAVTRSLPSAAPPEGAVPGGSAPTAVPGYEILGELGRGGMGVVYKARQTKLNRTVALKMILSGAHAGAADLDRFRTEAEAVARLTHPNIVQIHEVGEYQGLPFFSLEFCPGGSLEKKLSGTPLPPKEAAALVQKLAGAMSVAHQKGILHRDLKPANVLLAEDGTPRITDFGLAKKLGEVGQTATGAVMGTPSYMAPEQAGGRSKELGPACDVYALGAILYECLTGRPPFRAATAVDTVLQVIGTEPAAVRVLQPGVPRDLETISHKCLRKEPGKRYATAQELADDLRRFQDGEPIRARPVGWVERAVKWVRRRPTAAALVAVGVLLAIGAVVGGLAYEQQLQRSRAEGRRESLLAALRTADTPEVGRIVDELDAIRDLVAPELRAIRDDPAASPREKLHASLALLPGDSGQVDYLYDRLLTAEAQEVVVLRDALRLHAKSLSDRLWAVLEEANGDPDQRLRAACALAGYTPDDARWPKVSQDVTERLLVENVLVLGL